MEQLITYTGTIKRRVLKMKNRNKESTRYYSDIQESHVANVLGGYKNSNSGAGKFSAGDVTISRAKLLVECKTCLEEKESFSIKRDWLRKNREEVFSKGLDYGALAFNFGPNTKNYYIINEGLMEFLVDKMEEALK